MPQAAPVILTAVASSVTLTAGQVILANLAIAFLSGLILSEFQDDPIDRSNPIKGMSRSNVKPRQLAYGRSLITGPMVAFHTLDRAFENVLHVAIALTGHPIEGFDIIHLDEYKIRIPEDVIGTRGTEINAEEIEGSGNVYYIDGQDPDSQMALDLRQSFREPWCGFGSSVTNSQALSCTKKLNEIAYAGYTLDFNPEIWSSIPNLKVEIRGKLIRDAQEMYTLQQGANDPMDAVARYSTNWADCVLDYLMDPYLGLGTPVSEINLESFNNASLLADEQVETFVGSGIFLNRYTCNGVLQLDATPISILETLLGAGFGSLTYTQGKYKIFGGEYIAPLLADEDIITEDDLAGPVKLRISIPRADRFSAVRGTYLDSNNLFVPSNFPEVVNETYRLADVGSDNYLEANLDGYVYKEVDLPLTIDVSTAQRLAKLFLDTARQGLLLEIVVNMTGLKYSVGDNVKVNFPTLTLGDDTNPGFIAATANTPVLAADVVSTITTLEKGAGYIYPPEVVITGDGTGAIAIAVLEAGTVSEIIVLDGGSGYTTVSAAITDASSIQSGFEEPLQPFKIFKVESWVPNKEGTITMLLREDAAGSYDDFDTVTTDTAPDISTTQQVYEYAPRGISLNTGTGLSTPVDGGGWAPAVEALITEARVPSFVDHYEVQIGKGNNTSFNITSVFANTPVEEPALSGKYTSIVDLELTDTVLSVPSFYAAQGNNNAIGVFNFNTNIGTAPAPEYIDVVGNFQNYGDETEPTPTSPPGATGTPSISSLSVSASGVPPSAATSEYILKTTGTVVQDIGAGEQFLENWLLDIVGIVPGDWEVFASASGSVLNTGTLETWVPLSTERSWQLFSSAGTSKTTRLTVTIREIALPANSVTALITISITPGGGSA